jgi:RsiW-degrading membrane proteinase PrsW (M82 family)
MITAALGLSALENALFIINPLLQKEIAGAVSAGGFRFIGASLIHIVSSATIGLAFALSFFKTTKIKAFWVSLSFVLAVIFHTAFNVFIYRQNVSETFVTFGVVWFAVTLLLLFFERIKALRPNRIKI